MLIESDRHRSNDLELWREHEAADIVHGRSYRVCRLAEQSTKAIREFVEAGPCAAWVSWGKDSVVLAHLIKRAGVDIPVVNIRAIPLRDPHCDEVRDAFLAGHSIRFVEHAADYRHAKSEGDVNQIFKAAIRDAERELRVSRRITGIAADESGGRKLRFLRWGLATDNTLGPLGWWKVADVFGYAAVHGLPLHPTYAMMGGGRWPRDRLRVAYLGAGGALGRKGDGHGRHQWEREYYGDVLARMQANPTPSPCGGER